MSCEYEQNPDYLILERCSPTRDGAYNYDAEPGVQEYSTRRIHIKAEGLWKEYPNAWRTDCDNCVYYCIMIRAKNLHHHATYAHAAADGEITLQCICRSSWKRKYPKNPVENAVRHGYCTQNPFVIAADTEEILTRGWDEGQKGFSERIYQLRRKYELRLKQEGEGLNPEENDELRNLVLMPRPLQGDTKCKDAWRAKLLQEEG